MSNSHTTTVDDRLLSIDPMDRLREYMSETCERVMCVEGNFQFKSYRWPEVVNLLDEQEKAYRL